MMIPGVWNGPDLRWITRHHIQTKLIRIQLPKRNKLGHWCSPGLWTLGYLSLDMILGKLSSQVMTTYACGTQRNLFSAS